MGTEETPVITPENPWQALENITRGGVGDFGAVLAMNYDKVELNKSFDVFSEKPINYTIK